MNKLISAALFLAVFTACGTKQTTSHAPVELTKAEFVEKVANYETTPGEWHYLGDRPAVVDFYASWCGPCRSMAPILDELAAEYGDRLVVYKVNTDEQPELAAVFGVQSLPTFLFIPRTGNPSMAVGAMSKEEFRQAIETIVER